MGQASSRLKNHFLSSTSCVNKDAATTKSEEQHQEEGDKSIRVVGSQRTASDYGVIEDILDTSTDAQMIFMINKGD